MVKGKQSSSKIVFLICDNGTTANGHDEVAAKIVKFYSGLLGSVDSYVTGADVDSLSQLLPQSLSLDLQQALV